MEIAFLSRLDFRRSVGEGNHENVANGYKKRSKGFSWTYDFSKTLRH